VRADNAISPSDTSISPFVANREPAVYRFRYRDSVIETRTIDTSAIPNRLLEKI